MNIACVISENFDLFNLLAYMCSEFSREQESSIVTKWSSCTEECEKEKMDEYSYFFDCIMRIVMGVGANSDKRIIEETVGNIIENR